MANIFGTAERHCAACESQLPATFFGVRSSGQRQLRCHACRSDDNAQHRMQLSRQARTGPAASVCNAAEHATHTLHSAHNIQFNTCLLRSSGCSLV